MAKPLTQERMEDALQYLSDTDEECALLKTEVERAHYKAKRIEDAAFMRLEGSVAAREAQSRTLPEAAAAWADYFELLHKFEGMRNRRATEAIAIEAWRSVNSNRRMAQ